MRSSLSLSLSLSLATVSAQEQAPAPAFKGGDTWQFNIVRKGITSSTEFADGIYELTVPDGKVKLFHVSGTQKNEIAINPDGDTQIFLSLVGKSDQQPDLKFPLSVGQKWSYQYQTRVPGARADARRSVEVNVRGMEQVTTPAGTFKSYKLVRSESWTGAGRFATVNSRTVTYFYSPDSKSTIQWSSVSDTGPGTVNIELVKFTPGN